MDRNFFRNFNPSYTRNLLMWVTMKMICLRKIVYFGPIRPNLNK